eukprot:CFRG3778T1
MIKPSSGPLWCHNPIRAENENHVERNFLAMVSFALLCALSYYGTYAIMTRNSKTFRNMSAGDKADCAARTYSTLHAVVVPIGLLCVVFNNRLWDDILDSSAHYAEIFFACSCGYFAFDAYVVSSSKLDNWVVFVIHHIFGVMSYFMACFVPGCSQPYYILCLGLMVEFANPLINALWWMDKYSKTHLNIYAWVLYSHYVVWIIVRQLLPVYLTYLIVRQVIPAYGLCMCIIPMYLTGLFIVPFCTYVFVFLLTPELRGHIRSKAERRRKRKSMSVKRRGSTGIQQVTDDLDDALGPYVDRIEDRVEDSAARMQPVVDAMYDQLPDMPEPPPRIREVMDQVHAQARPMLLKLPDMPRKRKNLPGGV